MTYLEETEETKKPLSGKDLFLEYPWFYDNIYARLKETAEEFFQKEYEFRFISVSYNNENILFPGDEYFVNKFKVNEDACVTIRVSSDLAASLLDDALGAAPGVFSFSDMTDIEAGVIKSYTIFVYNKLEGLFIKKEPDKKTLKKSKMYNFTFFVKSKGAHRGKIIISLPDYAVNGNIEFEFRDESFDLDILSSIEVPVTLRAGYTRVPLNDLKAVEDGDVIMLEDSDVNKMELIINGNSAEFNITPNPALIISVDKSGESSMNSEESRSGSMWDTIMVDVTAEFDGFKMTLGDLKQISEGLLVDIGSVYEGRVKLKAAKQVIASGELVILNDRYGVRIDSISRLDDSEGSEEDEEEKEYNEEYDDGEAEETSDEAENDDAAEAPAAKKRGKPSGKDGAENFDYRDFEIEDESI